MSTLSFADLTAVPIEIYIKNINWPTALTVNFQIETLLSSSNFEQPLPPSVTFTAALGKTEGKKIATYLRNILGEKLNGILNITYVASVSGEPNSKNIASFNGIHIYPVNFPNSPSGYGYTLDPPIDEIYQMGNNVCEFQCGIDPDTGLPQLIVECAR